MGLAKTLAIITASSIGTITIGLMGIGIGMNVQKEVAPAPIATATPIASPVASVPPAPIVIREIIREVPAPVPPVAPKLTNNGESTAPIERADKEVITKVVTADVANIRNAPIGAPGQSDKVIGNQKKGDRLVIVRTVKTPDGKAWDLVKSYDFNGTPIQGWIAQSNFQ